MARVLATKSLFEVLQLPAPTWDALGRPSWPHADLIGQSFRKLSFALHPDRASHDDAPRAFQILKRAKATLEDPVEREKYVNRFVEDQRSLPENSTWAGQGSASDRVRAQLERDAQVKALKKEEARERQAQILEQARQRRLAAESKAGALLARKRRLQAEDDADKDAQSSGDERADADRTRPDSPVEAAAITRPKPRAGKPFRKAFI